MSGGFLADLKEMKARGMVDEPLVRHHLRELCAEAIRCGIRSEQLLIGLKELWKTLPSSTVHKYLFREAEIWSTVVAHIVDVYYGAEATGL